jgi:hypothetical protein
MTNLKLTIVLLIYLSTSVVAQKTFPFDTSNWDISARAFVLENYENQDAIYIHQGTATLKNVELQNGTIEFDLFLTERRGYPGVYFRAQDDGNMESFYVRPHLSGQPDANQAAPVINGITAWQMYFGPSYSFPFSYKYDDWTHIKIVIKDEKAQVYMDYSEKPNFSWILEHNPRSGKLVVGGGGGAAHYANFTITEDEGEIVDFNPIINEKDNDLVTTWTISDKFEENSLNNIDNLDQIIESRNWDVQIGPDGTNVANISRVRKRRGSPGNTVFAKLDLDSEEAQTKLFMFGYSDRAMVILNGKPLYRGTNLWRSRDYRYLGTVGLFDSVYLPLKKGKNTLLVAVSEDFGGWGITGKFANHSNIKVLDQ